MTCCLLEHADILPIVLDYLDEPALSSLACTSQKAMPAVSAAWIRLAHHRHSSGGGVFIANVSQAKTFLRLRRERLRAEAVVCGNLMCTNLGKQRCSACKFAMYCSRYVRSQDFYMYYDDYFLILDSYNCVVCILFLLFNSTDAVKKQIGAVTNPIANASRRTRGAFYKPCIKITS